MKPSNPDKLFPLFITEKLDETRRYYVDTLGFSTVHDFPSYLQLRYGEGERAPELCFMRPDGFPDGVTRPCCDGKGVLVSLPTEDADDAYTRLKKAGARIEGEPANQPWGWRSFHVRDPNGVTLDFFHVYNDNAV